MRVQFLASRTFDDQASVGDLAQIMLLIERGWHVWYWPDPGMFEGTVYFAEMSHHLELAFKSYAKEFAYADDVEDRLVTVIEDDQEATPAVLRMRLPEASALLAKPLTVLVESRLTDGAFLWRMLNAVDADLAAAFRALRPPVEWQHGGGKTEIVRQLRALHDEAIAQGMPTRMVAIVDSDARYPGDPGEHTAEVRAAGLYAATDVHVLEKRAIENYVSDRMLDVYGCEVPGVAEVVTFLETLSDSQRDHFPVKSGIPAAPHPEEAKLYAGLSVPPGVVVQLPRLMEFVLGHGVMPTSDDVDDRGATDEIRGMAMTIRRNL